jgi:hypothetical protein
LASFGTSGDILAYSDPNTPPVTVVSGRPANQTAESDPLAEAITTVLRARYEATSQIGPLLALNLGMEEFLPIVQEQLDQAVFVLLLVSEAANTGPQGLQTLRDNGLEAIDDHLKTHTSHLRHQAGRERGQIVHALGEALKAIARAKADRRWVLFREPSQ